MKLANIPFIETFNLIYKFIKSNPDYKYIYIREFPINKTTLQFPEPGIYASKTDLKNTSYKYLYLYNLSTEIIQLIDISKLQIVNLDTSNLQETADSNCDNCKGNTPNLDPYCEGNCKVGGTCPSSSCKEPTPPPAPTPPTPAPPPPCSILPESKCTSKKTHIINYLSTTSASGQNHGPTPPPGPAPGPGPGNCKWDPSKKICCTDNGQSGCPSIKAVWAIPTKVEAQPTNTVCLGSSSDINTLINFGAGGTNINTAPTWIGLDYAKQIGKVENLWMTFGGAAAGFTSKFFDTLTSSKDTMKKLGYNGICIDWEVGGLEECKASLIKMVNTYKSDGFKVILVVAGLGVIPGNLIGAKMDQDITGVDFDYVMLMLYRKGDDSQGSADGQSDNCVQCCGKPPACGDCKSGCSSGNMVEYYIKSWASGNVVRAPSTSSAGCSVKCNPVGVNRVIPCWAFGKESGSAGNALAMQKSVSQLVGGNIAFWGYYTGDRSATGKPFPDLQTILKSFTFRT